MNENVKIAEEFTQAMQGVLPQHFLPEDPHLELSLFHTLCPPLILELGEGRHRVRDGEGRVLTAAPAHGETEPWIEGW